MTWIDPSVAQDLRDNSTTCHRLSREAYRLHFLEDGEKVSHFSWVYLVWTPEKLFYVCLCGPDDRRKSQVGSERMSKRQSTISPRTYNTIRCPRVRVVNSVVKGKLGKPYRQLRHSPVPSRLTFRDGRGTPFTSISRRSIRQMIVTSYSFNRLSTTRRCMSVVTVHLEDWSK